MIRTEALFDRRQASLYTAIHNQLKGNHFEVSHACIYNSSPKIGYKTLEQGMQKEAYSLKRIEEEGVKEEE